MMMELALSSELGLTHASSVIALVKRTEAEFGIVTHEFDPLKESAWPKMPPTHVPLEICPLLWLPDVSFKVCPWPSLKLYSAMSPSRLVPWNDTETVSPADGISRLALSSAARV